MKKWIHTTTDNSYIRCSEQREKQLDEQDKMLSQPVTLSNISKVISELKKETVGSIVKKGNYLRYTSHDDDFVEYYDLADVVKELTDDGVTIGDATADPDLILDCSSIGSYGIHHVFETQDYLDYKKDMNKKLGFSR